MKRQNNNRRKCQQAFLLCSPSHFTLHTPKEPQSRKVLTLNSVVRLCKHTRCLNKSDVYVTALFQTRDGKSLAAHESDADSLQNLFNLKLPVLNQCSSCRLTWPIHPDQTLISVWPWQQGQPSSPGVILPSNILLPFLREPVTTAQRHRGGCSSFSGVSLVPPPPVGGRVREAFVSNYVVLEWKRRRPQSHQGRLVLLEDEFLREVTTAAPSL